MIFFDAHGLHKPDPPVDTRLVLNVWFARSDFSGALPPTLVSLANISEKDMERAYIFKNSRGFAFKQISHVAVENASILLNLKKSVKNALKKIYITW